MSGNKAFIEFKKESLLRYVESIRARPDTNVGTARILSEIVDALGLEDKEDAGDNNGWHRTVNAMPDDDKVVLTKIDDKEGIRNSCYLKRHRGFWCTTTFEEEDGLHAIPSNGIKYPGKNIYTPTHWKHSLKYG